MKKLISLIALLLLPIVANHAHGVTISSLTDGKVTSQINYYNPIGQTFQAEGTFLNSFAFYYTVLNGAMPNSTITLSIYAGIGDGGALIGAETFSLDAAHNGLHAVNFSSLGSVFTIGNQYSAMLTNTNSYWGIYRSNNGYANGNAIEGGVAYESFDQRFSATFSSVPDTGSTAALLGAGVVALAFARRRLG